MLNDYERRFQCSLQKLPIPSWYIDPTPVSKRSSKQSIHSISQTRRQPEIVHLRRPQSYRSCRSSLATSPSPSTHSWHPTHMIAGMNFSRRYHQYEKGIERVSKSSHWYQPAQFVANPPNKHTGNTKISTLTKHRATSPVTNYYDTPQIHDEDKQRRQSPIHETADAMHMNQSLSIPMKKLIPSLEILPLSVQQIKDYDLFQSLVHDETNSGVRELSDDENGLRELDENDMSDTDEFIVFAPQPQLTISTIPRSSLNRLYTFAKTNDDTTKQTPLSPNSQQSFDDLGNVCPIDVQPMTIDRVIDRMINCSTSQLSIHKSSEGVNEETARIGRLLLNSIPTPVIEHCSQISIPYPTEEYLRISEEFDEEDIRHDSGYSSNQERLPIPIALYEPLCECYSGYSGVQNDFLATNISSIHSTTDEAYESEPTTMSSSIATTTTAHIHPDLEHEFEYPSPPPPIPDRRLKPAHLRTSLSENAHSIKPDKIDSAGYTLIQKAKPVPITAIQQLIGSIGNASPISSLKSVSCRHYCGSIPVSSDIPYSPSLKPETDAKEKLKDKRHGKTLNCLHSSAADEQDKRICGMKSSSSSLNKSKAKKHTIKEFDEATNGLAIRLPAPMTTGHDVTNKLTVIRISTPTSTKHRPILDDFKSIRSPFYETSV